MPGTRSVALAMWVDVGSRDERPAIAGSSHFLEHLLFKGTKTRTARQIAEAFDAMGGDLNAFSAKEYTCYYCRVLDRDLPTAIEFMADMIQNSEIAKVDVEAERLVILEEIHMHEDDPGDLIHDLFAETLWGAHPLGRPVLGTRETIGSISRAQIRGFYRSHYTSPRFVVAAAGNLRHEALCGLGAHLWATGRWEPELEDAVLGRVLPDIRVHLGLATSRTARPQWPAAQCATEGLTALPVLGDDDEAYAGWTRLALVERQYVRDPQREYRRPVEAVTVFAGAVAIPLGARVPPDAMPFTDGEVQTWWCPDPPPPSSTFPPWGTRCA